MGHGDDELNLSDAELAAAEQQTRRILARWGEPSPAPPPPALPARVSATLAGRPTRTARRRSVVPRVVAGVFVLCFGLGFWGIFGSSLGLAGLFGGPNSVLGGLVLAVALAAKPLVNMLAGAVFYVLPGLVLLAAAAWLWWRLLRGGPQPEVF
ncbi:MAG: hypothetical protein HC822_05895 [Oscillochloris sp.]|nr:hypothetical protein [Oscillochloris sp.]